jgi:phosphate-selective porin OprO/OprP
MRKVWVVVCVLAAAAPAVAGDDSLVDVLRRKNVLTEQEYQRLKGTELPPATREGLIEVLRAKGVLSADEAARLVEATPLVPAAAPTPEKTVELAAAPPAPTPQPQLGYDEGFFIRTQDGRFSLRFNGRVNELFVFQQPGTDQNSTMAIDRARLSVDGTFFKVFRLRVENDFASSSGLRDAYIAYVPMSEANLQLGQYKVPFSYEALLSSRYIPFVERAAVVRSTVDPSRDVGAMVYGHLGEGVLLYQLALMNGAGQNQRDNNSAKDVDLRLFATPLKHSGIAPLADLSVGGAFTYGVQPIGSESIEGITDFGFVFYPAVEAGGARQRWNGQLAWLYGPYSVTGEVIFTDEDRHGVGPDGSNLAPLKTNGAYIGGTWLLTGEAKPFNKRIYPKRPFLWPIGDAGWGAWEAALRYDYFDLQHTPDSASDLFPRNRYDALLAGVNWYPNEFTRLSVNYVYAHFLEAGEDLSPDPDRHSDNVVLGRAQIEF